MPLLDHFHAPLYPGRSWESFQAVWCTEIMGWLNQKILPTGFYAESQVHVGSRVEVDVATLEKWELPAGESNGPGGSVATEVWAPPQAGLVMPAVFPDEIEVQIFHSSGGAHLVGAIELVSHGNKDRGEVRRAFATKCASYLQQGIGLVVIDVVTERQANLHDELIRLLEQEERFQFPGAATLYTVSYQPVRREPGLNLFRSFPSFTGRARIALMVKRRSRLSSKQQVQVRFLVGVLLKHRSNCRPQRNRS